MYLDTRSGRTYPIDAGRWRGDDGAPLTVTPSPGIGPDDVDTGVRSLWRYRAALPGGIGRPVSLGEGCTPLVEGRWGETVVRFKLEWFSPTGSFKDRGTTVMMSLLAQAGVDAVVEDSSGNGGSSVAAYAAAAGIKARILAPEGTSPAKVLQSKAYGAEVVLVPGDRSATSARALRESADTCYASHNWHPFFLQGTKTLAYELWEDLGFTAPDNVVTVAGAGSIVLGCDLGFGELLAAGRIDRLPGCWSPSRRTARRSTRASTAAPTSRSPRRSPRAPRSANPSGCPRCSPRSAAPAVTSPRSRRPTSSPPCAVWRAWACTPSPPAPPPRRRSTCSPRAARSAPATRPSSC